METISLDVVQESVNEINDEIHKYIAPKINSLDKYVDKKIKVFSKNGNKAIGFYSHCRICADSPCLEFYISMCLYRVRKDRTRSSRVLFIHNPIKIEIIDEKD